MQPKVYATKRFLQWKDEIKRIIFYKTHLPIYISLLKKIYNELGPIQDRWANGLA
jgi:hypothetical protein